MDMNNVLIVFEFKIHTQDSLSFGVKIHRSEFSLHAKWLHAHWPGTFVSHCILKGWMGMQMKPTFHKTFVVMK